MPETDERTEREAPTRRPRRADVTSTRRTAQQRRRRRRLLTWLASLAGVVVVAGLVVMLAEPLGLRDSDPTAVGTDVALPGVGADDGQSTVLLVTFDETDAEQVATRVVLLGDNGEDGATVVFIPTTTVAEVPGHGPLQLGTAHALGSTPLLELTVDNLLGIDSDAAVGVSRQAWAQFFARLGGLEIDVPTSLTEVTGAGDRRVRFEPGEQFLDGERLAEYLTFTEDGESELSQLPRFQRVLEAALDAIAAEPERLDPVFADGAPFLDTTQPELVASLLRTLAIARADDQLDVRTLPVEAIGSGDQSSYRLDTPRSDALMDERFAASRPVDGEATGRRLQILNGNGEPGVGQFVAARLQPAGYRVILTRNADRFDYPFTRIVVYADTPEQLALARDVQERLGVGQIELSETPQRVADITVVVGADFTG